jgi:hypothetical protein
MVVGTSTDSGFGFMVLVLVVGVAGVNRRRAGLQSGVAGTSGGALKRALQFWQPELSESCRSANVGAPVNVHEHECPPEWAGIGPGDVRWLPIGVLRHDGSLQQSERGLGGEIDDTSSLATPAACEQLQGHHVVRRLFLLMSDHTRPAPITRLARPGLRSSRP